MANFRITDPDTGRTIVVREAENREEAEAEAERHFANTPAPSAPQAPAEAAPLASAAGPVQGEAGLDFSGFSVRNLRPLAIGTGAALGTAAGGGLTPTGAVGGALGVAGASALFDASVGAGRDIGVVGPEGIVRDDPQAPGRAGGPLGIARRAAMEGAIDLAAPGLASIGKRAAISGFRRIASTTSELSQRIQSYASELGVPLAVENVTDSRVLSKARETIGKFPFFSKPFRQIDIEQGEALGRVQEELISAIAPIASTITDTGVDLSNQALRRSRGVRMIFNREYTKLLDDATAEGAEIPTSTVRQVARDLIDSFKGKLPTRIEKVPFGKSRSRDVVVPIDPKKGGIDTGVIDFAEELSTLTDTMTPRQFKGFQTILNDLISSNRDNTSNTGRAIALRRALEEDFEQIAGSPELVGRLRGLNGAFREWATLLERPTGKRLAKADRGVFEIGELARPGSVNEDELFRTVWNSRSAGAMNDLASLVGPAGMRRSLRLHIEEAFRGSFDETTKIVDINKAKSALGIGAPRSAERAAFSAALKNAKVAVTTADFDKFFTVAEKAIEQSPTNVSQFIARRATLGGSRALVRAFNPGNIFTGATAGAAAGGGVVGGILGTSVSGLAIGIMAAFQSRRALSLLTKPGALKIATRALDPDIALSVRKQNFLRLARLIGEEGMREIESGFESAAEAFASAVDAQRREVPSTAVGSQ